jgi:L,D-transpeptidase YcbB
MKRTLFFILFFMSSFVHAQTSYKELCIELLRQAKLQYVINDKSLTQLDKELEPLTEGDATKAFFYKLSKQIFFETKYGHKPYYLQFEALQEIINETHIDSLALSINTTDQINKTIQDLEPNNPEFRRYKKAIYSDSLFSILQDNLNLFRYLNRFETDKYLIVNIPNAKLTAYDKNQKILEMNIIAGKKDKQTPRMATFLDAIIVYPYWTPTRSIALNEILPKVKKNIKYLENNNFDVLDAQRKIVKPDTLKWATFSSKNFPYTFRQGTGCDNSLGLLKFNINNPFSVYMHDTSHNTQSMSLFEKEDRFFSHGCMRLSKPVELANWALNKIMLTEEFMNTCLKDPKTSTLKLPKKIPVFVIYNTSEINAEGNLITFKDIYNLK